MESINHELKNIQLNYLQNKYLNYENYLKPFIN